MAKKWANRTKRYQFKNTAPTLECPVKHLCTVDQQEEKSIGASTRKALKKITNAIKKTRNYRTRQEINEHIRTIKDNGVTITQFNGTRKVNGEHSLIMHTTSNARSIYWACLI
jgi:hypothetical protein